MNLGQGSAGDGGTQALDLYCAAGMRRPVEELCSAYERETGVPVRIQYAGSGTLLSSLQASRSGDLYVAGDVSFVDRAVELGLAREVFPLARMTPVLAVATGNPLGIQRLEDLSRSDVRLGLGDPGAAAIGKVTRTVLETSGLWEEVFAGVKVTEPTVESLATALSVGALDAAIIWDATARSHDLEYITLQELSAAPRNVTLGVLTSARQPAALRLARYLSSGDLGARAFTEHGFEPVDGDPWDPEPVLSLFSGAMLHAAIDKRITAFEEREGVEVRRTYNGCGILVAQMRAGATPDAYFSCDTSFLDAVADRFEPGLDVSRNPIVLVVSTENPRNIRTLEDLLLEDLRVGLADEEKSALGALTAKVLHREGLYDALESSGNVRVRVPTGDLLVNQLRTGALDAVLVYLSNAARAGDGVLRLPIHEAAATQPWAISTSTRHARLADRLRVALTDPESRASFEDLGFDWILEEDAR